MLSRSVYDMPLRTGISNSAGAWMVPGFQLHSSRLDLLSPKPPAALAAMRFPAALAPHKPPAQQQQQQQQGAMVGEVGEHDVQQQQHKDFLPDLQEQQQQQNGTEQQQQQDGCCEQPGHCEPAATSCDHHHQQAVDALQQLNLQQQQHNAGGSLQDKQLQQQPWFRYLVLDCDGVLVDTEAASCESLRRAILQVTGEGWFS
jgi:hypothetical protein